MFRLLSLFFFLAAGFIVGSSAQNCFSCPTIDGGNFVLGKKTETSDPIFCSYPVMVKEDPNDFYCTYNVVRFYFTVFFYFQLEPDPTVGLFHRKLGHSSKTTMGVTVITQRLVLPARPSAMSSRRPANPRPNLAGSKGTRTHLLAAK